MKKPLIKVSFGVLLIGGLLGGYLYANHSAAGDYASLDAVTVSRSGSFELDMTPEEALPLFTAPGERLWVPSWNPVVLNGDGFEKGTVFVTPAHGSTTYWLVMDYDIGVKHALYARVTPELHTGTVDVSIESNGMGGSIVNVSYQLTALSPMGNRSLQDSFSEPKYNQMMKDWQTMVKNNEQKIDQQFSS